MVDSRHRDYSATPLPAKLGIREGSRVLLSGAPPGFELEPLPSAVRIVSAARAPIDVAVLFVTRRSDLRRRFRPLAAKLVPAGRLWIGWPKRSSGVPTDLTFEAVQRIGLDVGLVDNKSASLGEVFQGLQFVHRLRDRPRG